MTRKGIPLSRPAGIRPDWSRDLGILWPLNQIQEGSYQAKQSRTIFAALGALAVLMCILSAAGFIFWYVPSNQGTMIVVNNAATGATSHASIGAAASDDADFNVSLAGVQLA